eukprot:g55016.t1
MPKTNLPGHNRRRRLGVTRKRSKNAEKPGSGKRLAQRSRTVALEENVVQARGELLNRSIFSPPTPTPTPKAQVKLVFAHTRTASSSSTSFSRLTQLGSGKAEADVEEEVIVEDKLRHALTCTHKLVQRIEWGDEKIVMERYRNQYQEIVIASMPRVRAGNGEEGNVARKAKRRRKKRRDAVVAGLTELVDEAQGISKEDLEEGQTMINEMGEQWGRQTKQLLRLVKHPFLTSSLLLKHKKTVTETVVEQFRLKGSADRQSASVDFDAVMSYFYELLKDSKLVEAAKLFPVDVNGKPLAPMPTPTSQDALFPLLIAKCNEKQEELEVVCQDVLRRLEKVQDAGGWKHPTTGVTLPTIKLFVIDDMKWLLECTGRFAAALIREIIEGMPKTPWLGGEPLTEEWRNHEDRVREFERLLRNDPIPGAAGGARPRGPVLGLCLV